MICKHCQEPITHNGRYCGCTPMAQKGTVKVCVQCGDRETQAGDKCSRWMGNVEHIFDEHDFHISAVLR